MFASAFKYDQYDLSSYQRHQGPPIIDKSSRILASTVQNQIEILQELLDSPEWYYITDSDGYTLLQIAMLRGNEKIFDYLLSIPDFPINSINNFGETTLEVALPLPYRDGYFSMSEHFAYELLKKDASFGAVYSRGYTPLHLALYHSYEKVALLLIEKGVDLDVPDCNGCTPLECAVSRRLDSEVVCALLANGTTASVNVFESSIWHSRWFLIQEVLFLYIFDEYSNAEVDLPVIFHLANIRSPFFYELLKYPIKARISDRYYVYFNSLCSMDIDYLKTITEKFSKQIKQALEKSLKWGTAVVVRDSGIFMRNLNFLFEKSNLRSALISYISNFKSFRGYEHLIRDELNQPDMAEIYCFLLSYGRTIYEWDVHFVYNKFRYCELFKIFLHMDIKVVVKGIKDIMPTLIYDVTADLEQFLDHPEKYTRTDIKELCSYFVHPRLREMYLKEYREIPDFPRVPLLTELCRNTFRKYFIELFETKTSRKFYTLLNCLPISRDYKKIISYETKLY